MTSVIGLVGSLGLLPLGHVVLWRVFAPLEQSLPFGFEFLLVWWAEVLVVRVQGANQPHREPDCEKHQK
jgi:hypothetical protein